MHNVWPVAGGKSSLCMDDPDLILLNPKSDQNLISPYTNYSWGVIKVVKIKGMIANIRSFG